MRQQTTDINETAICHLPSQIHRIRLRDLAKFQTLCQFTLVLISVFSARYRLFRLSCYRRMAAGQCLPQLLLWAAWLSYQPPVYRQTCWAGIAKCLVPEYSLVDSQLSTPRPHLLVLVSENKYWPLKQEAVDRLGRSFYNFELWKTKPQTHKMQGCQCANDDV